MRAIAVSLLLVMCTAAFAGSVTYDLLLTLYVPRVYDNAESRGYRRYQLQRIQGTLTADTDVGLNTTVTLSRLVNRTHHVNGQRVSYDVYMDPGCMFTLVGSNKTGVFRTASALISFTADPSYNVGGVDEDNTLILTMAGKGSERSIRGYVAGQLGCGCSAYGHVSPTRTMWTYLVTDVAPVFGRFTLKKR